MYVNIITCFYIFILWGIFVHSWPWKFTRTIVLNTADQISNVIIYIHTYNIFFWTKGPMMYSDHHHSLSAIFWNPVWQKYYLDGHCTCYYIYIHKCTCIILYNTHSFSLLVYLYLLFWVSDTPQNSTCVDILLHSSNINFIMANPNTLFPAVVFVSHKFYFNYLQTSQQNLTATVHSLV
jgi:hypothetical protein